MTEPSPSTEARNPATRDIDVVPPAQRLRMILAQDAVAVAAAQEVIPALADLVQAAVDRVRAGGRIHYAGAGASGRLAVLDATESTPTFGVDPGLIRAHFPGGAAALTDSTIDLEDAADQGRAALTGVGAGDVVIGVSASGSTAYVRGALESAGRAGALTALITSNPRAPLGAHAQILIAPDTGAEALTGSTRLKAATAAKVLLNAFSTAVMIGLGRTYSNLMVGLVASNEKLRERSVAILREATGSPAAQCRTTLLESSGRVPVALVRLLTGASVLEAEGALARAGSVRTALDLLAGDCR
ncbi:N-acetylmuramic acid 6-phosphate etherase [Pseudactinotalea sp. Z1748]|uniref:N-acetylmuramic acid 6-phosphate etherase n=1 Tax=Pseudactinotalea sp. Z1748 TaxID=3413027 RepID=UPI003C7C080B